MAGELLQAVTSGGAFDLKTLTDTFAAVADRNLKARELDLREKEAAQNSVLKAAGMDLREQALSLRTTQAATAAQGRELSNSLNILKLQNAQQALLDAQHYAEDIASTNKDGKSLAVRLKSEDPVEADEAYRTFAAIRDKYRASPSTIVTNDIKAMEGMPVVQTKTELARRAEERRQQDVDRKDRQGDRRLDQHDTIIADAEGVNADKSAQGWTRIETGQRNATTRERNADARLQGKDGEMGITLPNIGHVSMPKIRSVLARGMASDATAQEVSDADVLRKSILAVPSGNKNPDTGAIVPRFSNDDIVKWTTEGQSAAKAKPAPSASAPAPGPVTGPESRPGAKRTYSYPPEPLPVGGVTSSNANPQVMPAPAAPSAVPAAPSAVPAAPASPPSAPSSSESIIPGLPPMLPDPPDAPATTAPAASPTPASEILKRYKIPGRPKPTGALGTEPSTPDSLYAATQSFMAGLGIIPAPEQAVGFGGFGFGLPPV